MRILIILVVVIGLGFTQSPETYQLRDGTTVIGTLIKETDTQLIIQTSYGEIKIYKANLIKTEYVITMKSGEKLRGTKENETNETLIINTQLGKLNISKSDIIDIQEVGTQHQNQSTYYPRNRGLLDTIFGSYSHNKGTEFVLGEEQLIDLFFDPTGYTLNRSTLYLSGLSFGFGITDNFQVTTKWGGFFRGDMNIRPKLQVFEVGNWESQTSLAIGGHYHSRWMPNKYEWQSGSLTVNTIKKHWGGFYRINENPEYEVNQGDSNLIDRKDETDEDYFKMIEFFGAITHSTSRKGVKGRISHTIGGNIQYIPDLEKLLYRGYYGLDVDINSKLKMIGEVFYDPLYLEFWQMINYNNSYYHIDEFSNSPVEKPSDYNSVHFDFGFMYAFNESFRFGLHFQQPWIAFYWKF